MRERRLKTEPGLFRPTGPVAALLAAVLLIGCRDGNDTTESSTETGAPDNPKIAGEEDDVLARRDALLKARQTLREKRQELAERRREVRRTGGDTSELDAMAQTLLDRERKLVEEEAALNDKYEAILSQRRTMIQSLASTSDEDREMAAREAALATREQELARRENGLAEREAKLAARERELAHRERTMCSEVATIVQENQSRGDRYTRGDVEPLLRRARRRMEKKGLLRSDLPGPSRKLEREATRAMEEGDFGRARFAAAQLMASVSSVAVDKGFIAGKISRLNHAIDGVSLDGNRQDRVDKLFRQATSSYGDGAFTAANRHLNAIYALLP